MLIEGTPHLRTMSLPFRDQIIVSAATTRYIDIMRYITTSGLFPRMYWLTFYGG